MKVLHVIPSVAMRDGGPAVAIRAMASALAARGADVTVASTNSDGATATLDVPLEEPVRDGGVEFRYFARSIPGEWKFSWPLTRWLYDHAAQFDVVHVHALFSYATIPACRSARRARVPYVMRPLGTLDPWSLGHRSWKKAPYLSLVERGHLRHAAAIHVTSESEGEAVRALGYGHLVRVIPLGVAPGEQVERRASSPSQPARILFLSRLHPKKGIPLLLDALAQLAREGGEAAKFELVIGGGGPDSYRAQLQERARELGIGERVRFAGHVEGEAKARLLAESDLFVLPSQQENFGIAVAEALAAGLPVIVSDQVAIADDVRQADAGLVAPLEPARWAEAIGRLARSPELRRVQGERASRLARERYSWDRTAERLLELYRTVARGRGGRARSA